MPYVYYRGKSYNVTKTSESEGDYAKGLFWLSAHSINTDALKKQTESINLAQYCGKPLCVLDEGGFMLGVNDEFASIISIPDTMRISYPFVGRFLDSPSTVLLRTAIECYDTMSLDGKVYIEPCVWASRFLETVTSLDSYDWALTRHEELFVLYARCDDHYKFLLVA
jgi:hypothetical protein